MKYILLDKIIPSYLEFLNNPPNTLLYKQPRIPTPKLNLPDFETFISLPYTDPGPQNMHTRAYLDTLLN